MKTSAFHQNDRRDLPQPIPCVIRRNPINSAVGLAFFCSIQTKSLADGSRKDWIWCTMVPGETKQAKSPLGTPESQKGDNVRRE